MKKKILFVFFLLSGFIYSQGDDLLLLQYNKGPDPDGFYRKWNYDIHFLTTLMNAKGKYSNPALSLGFGSSVQYKFSKTFGIRSGASFLNIRYKYTLSGNDSTDKITYLTIPITARVFPSRKLIFETGFLYNLLLSAENSEVQDITNGSFNYEDGIFKEEKEVYGDCRTNAEDLYQSHLTLFETDHPVFINVCGKKIWPSI